MSTNINAYISSHCSLLILLHYISFTGWARSVANLCHDFLTFSPLSITQMYTKYIKIPV